MQEVIKYKIWKKKREGKSKYIKMNDNTLK